MSGLPGVEEIRSVSRFGLSAVTIVFEEGTDLLRARQLVSERLAKHASAFRAAPGHAELGPMSSGLGEILQFEVRADKTCAPGQPDTEHCYTPMELRTVLDWFVAYRAASVPWRRRGKLIRRRAQDVRGRGLPEPPACARSLSRRALRGLERNNAIAGGGAMVRAGEQLLVRGEGRIDSLEEIGDVRASRPAPKAFPFACATSPESHLAPMIRQGAVTRDGRGEVVTGIVMMLVGANGREVVESVKASIDRHPPSLPPGVRLDVFYDRADLVNRTIHTEYPDPDSLRQYAPAISPETRPGRYFCRCASVPNM